MPRRKLLEASNFSFLRRGSTLWVLAISAFRILKPYFRVIASRSLHNFYFFMFVPDRYITFQSTSARCVGPGLRSGLLLGPYASVILDRSTHAVLCTYANSDSRLAYFRGEVRTYYVQKRVKYDSTIFSNQFSFINYATGGLWGRGWWRQFSSDIHSHS